MLKISVEPGSLLTETDPTPNFFYIPLFQGVSGTVNILSAPGPQNLENPNKSSATTVVPDPVRRTIQISLSGD